MFDFAFGSVDRDDIFYRDAFRWTVFKEFVLSRNLCVRFCIIVTYFLL